MKATVSILYKNGTPVPREKRPKVIDGSISMSFSLHPVLKRNVAQTVLLNAEGAHLADPLFDATCTNITADGLVFRGWESGSGGREQMQEWFVRPTPTAVPAH